MSNRKILLVDDSKSARYALRLLLQKHDYLVDTAESAESALEKIHAQPPDAVFMDHLMPGMNGFEALELLKRDPRTAHIPVVMCTSNDDAPYLRQAREKGALDILPKPATSEKLNAILHAIDAAIETHATAPAAPAEAPAPAAAPVQPVVDVAAILEQVRGELPALVRAETEQALRADLGPSLDAALAGLRADLGSDIAEQVSRRLDAVQADLQQTASQGGVEGLEQRLDTEIQSLRSDLVKLETGHAQALAYKLSHDVLPGLIDTQVAGLEVRLVARLEEITRHLTDELPRNAELLRRVSETAEQRASEIVQSQEVAEAAAGERAAEMTDSLMRATQGAIRRMYLLAGAAAAAGVLSSLVVYFLVN